MDAVTSDFFFYKFSTVKFKEENFVENQVGCLKTENSFIIRNYSVKDPSIAQKV